MIGIKGGTVYDPLKGVEGHVQDLWIKNGKVVSPEDVDKNAAQIIDASGKIIMPGGVDIHSHIAGAKVIKATGKECPIRIGIHCSVDPFDRLSLL